VTPFVVDRIYRTLVASPADEASGAPANGVPSSVH
jgi:hypothetical protein